MPTYAYYCTSCENKFDRFLSMDDREIPLSEACEKCGCSAIARDYTSFSQPISSDMNLTPDKKTGGQWSQLMNKMKKGTSPRYHKTLDMATNRRGTKWH